MTTQARPAPLAGGAGQAQAVEEVDGRAGSFDALLAETAVVLAEFGAAWCPPCRAMEPALSRLAGEYAGRARVVSVDTERYPGTVARYAVLGLPTVVVFRRGQEVDRLLGLRPIGALRQALERALDAPAGGA